MFLQPVIITIPLTEDLSGPKRISRQREYTRRALAECAKLCGVPLEGWQQDANRVPMPNGKYYWSISHKPLYAAAVISDQSVGIDIEHVQPRRNTDLWEKIAEPQEWSHIGERDWLSFYILWTAKEAVLKANGLGIGSLERCRVYARLSHQQLLVLLDAREWRVEYYCFQDHLVCVTSNDQPVHWRVV